MKHRKPKHPVQLSLPFATPNRPQFVFGPGRIGKTRTIAGNRIHFVTFTPKPHPDPAPETVS